MKRTLARILTLSLLIAAAAFSRALAVPAYPGEVKLTDANGSTVRAYLHGDEFFAYATDLNGNLIQRDAGGTYRYVVASGDGLALGQPVSGGTWLMSATGARVRPEAYAGDLKAGLNELRAGMSAMSPSRYGLRGLPYEPDDILPTYDYQNDPLKGKLEACDISAITKPDMARTCSLLVLKVEFSDVKCLYDDQAWHDRIFVNGVNAFYTENSNGAFTYVPAQETYDEVNDGVVTVTLPIARPLYTYTGTGQNSATGARTGLYQAQDASGRRYAIFNDSSLYAYGVEAASAVVDFESYDTNRDGYVSPTELAVLVVVAGNEAAAGAVAGKPMTWSHSWESNNIMAGTPPQGDIGYYAVKLGSVRLYKYIMIAENLNAAYNYDDPSPDEPPLQAQIGTACHELGHDLGLADLYDTSQSRQEREVGVLSLMAYGAWGCMEGGEQGSMPTHLDAYSKLYLGFFDATTVSEPGAYPLIRAASPERYHVLRLNTRDPDVYLLVENRTLAGFDRGLAVKYPDGGGLVYWRIDEGVIRDFWDANLVNNTSGEYSVMPEYIVQYGMAWSPFRSSDTYPMQKRYLLYGNKTLSLRSNDLIGARMNLYIDELKPPPLTGDGARPWLLLAGLVASALAALTIRTMKRTGVER